uniref:Uncharacterized protein n=1 Tax=Trichogramma kaykai TaxID=54128 RepID=A0ABD2WNU7_9HYME
MQSSTAVEAEKIALSNHQKMLLMKVPGVICIDEKKTKKGSDSEHQCVSNNNELSERRKRRCCNYKAENVNFFLENRQNNLFQYPIWKYFHHLYVQKQLNTVLHDGTIRIYIDRNLHFQLKVCWRYAISCRLLRHVNFVHALQDERRNVTHAPPRASMRGIGCVTLVD